MLDEPTNHLDLDMRHALTVALQGFEGAVITVSHDRHLLEHTVDTFWLVANRSVTRFNGDLNDYRRWLSDQSRVTSHAPSADKQHGAHARREQRRDQAAHRARIKPLQNKVERLTRQVDEATQDLARLEKKRWAEPDLYQDDNQDRLSQLLAEQTRLRQSQQKLESEWMEAEQALEQGTRRCGVS